MAYSFPSDAGLVCLAVVVHEGNLAEFKADKEDYLRAFYAKLPDAPDLSQAERASDFVGAANTPNTYRWPVRPGLALIGDAAMASTSGGVGWGWALQSASYLVDRLAPALKWGAGIDRALRRYAKQRRAELYTEHVRNSAFSATDNLPFLLAAPLAAAPYDSRLRELMALSAHRISQRDLRILLRLAFYHLTRLFRRAAGGAGAVVHQLLETQLLRRFPLMAALSVVMLVAQGAINFFGVCVSHRAGGDGFRQSGPPSCSGPRLGRQFCALGANELGQGHRLAPDQLLHPVRGTIVEVPARAISDPREVRYEMRIQAGGG